MKSLQRQDAVFVLQLFLCDDIGYSQEIDTFAQEVESKQAKGCHCKRKD